MRTIKCPACGILILDDGNISICPVCGVEAPVAEFFFGEDSVDAWKINLNKSGTFATSPSMKVTSIPLSSANEESVITCNFCNRKSTEVARMFSGRNSYICSQCVIAANKVLMDENNSKISAVVPQKVEAVQVASNASSVSESVSTSSVGTTATSDDTSSMDDFVIENNVLVSYRGKSEVVNIPDGIKKIGNRCFKGNEAIRTVNFPNSVETIEDAAFAYCYNLTTVKLPNDVSELPISLFHNCTSLVNVNIPANIKLIRYYAFGGCESLKHIELPQSNFEIEDGAFFNTGIEELEIPVSVNPSNISTRLGCDFSYDYENYSFEDSRFYVEDYYKNNFYSKHTIDNCCKGLKKNWVNSDHTRSILGSLNDYIIFNHRLNGKCSYCGGDLMGLVFQKCTECGKDKDY